MEGNLRRKLDWRERHAVGRKHFETIFSLSDL